MRIVCVEVGGVGFFVCILIGVGVLLMWLCGLGDCFLDVVQIALLSAGILDII